MNAGDCDAATGTLIQKAGVARECRSPLSGCPVFSIVWERVRSPSSMSKLFFFLSVPWHEREASSDQISVYLFNGNLLVE